MKKYIVEVQQTTFVHVEVEAEDPTAAFEKVAGHDFDLPPREEWDHLDGWDFIVRDETGAELLEVGC